MRKFSSGPRAWLRDLDPACFAAVMATGIVSRAMRLDGADVLSAALLVVGLTAFAVLSGAYAWRLAAYRREWAADARDPRRAFGYFTFGAGAGVLSAGLAADGHPLPAAVLLALGAAGWLLPGYAVPMLLAGAPAVRPALAGATGTWFVWAVGVQSVAVAATAFTPHVPAALSALAICCWMIGVLLYLIIAVLVVAARFEFPLRDAKPTGSYWVFMGATAISVLAAAQILRLPGTPRDDVLLGAVRPVVSGLSVMLWAFGTWLIPLLIAVAVWRHLLRRVPLSYEPVLWSVVFPIGMYGVASREFGTVLRLSWMVTLGRYEAWAGLAAWTAVSAAMTATAVRRAGRLKPWRKTRLFLRSAPLDFSAGPEREGGDDPDCGR